MAKKKTTREAKQVSLKQIGSTVEGLFMGIEEKVKSDGSGILPIIHFQNPKNPQETFTCVGNFKIMEFLTDNEFPSGEYLKITKVDQVEISGGRKLGIFEYEHECELNRANLMSVADVLEQREEKARLEAAKEEDEKDFEDQL